MKKFTIGLLILSLLTSLSIVALGRASTSTSHGIKVDVNELTALKLKDSSRYRSADESFAFRVKSDDVSAGSLPNDLTYNTKSLDYTVLKVNGNNFKLQAKLDSTPSNYQLLVEAGQPSASKGNGGSTAGEKVLSTTPKNLITGIGSTVATTNLTYRLHFTDVPTSGHETYTVTYTLTSQ